MDIVRLAVHPELYPPTVQLIEKAFHYREENRFDRDFALLLHPRNLTHSYLLVDADGGKKRVAGHIGIMIRELALPSLNIPVALIGGIAMDEDYRGQGHFRPFFNTLLDRYLPRVALFLLWSDHISLYEKFQFHLSFGQLETKGPPIESMDSGFQRTNYAALSSREKKQIQRIYQEDLLSHYTTLVRTDRQWQDIEMITSSELFILQDAHGHIQSYFFRGKGQDLTGIIHEVGCLEDRAQLLRKLSCSNLWLPERDRSSLSRNREADLKFMGLARLGHPALLGRLVQEWSGGKMTMESIENSQVRLRFEGEKFNFNKADFLSLIFGPNPCAEFTNMGRALFISGLDSI